MGDAGQHVGEGGQIPGGLRIQPLEASRGPAVTNANPATAGKVFNIGYLVLVTDSLKATSGASFAPDALYSNIKSAPANCSTITDATQRQVCLLT